MTEAQGRRTHIVRGDRAAAIRPTGARSKLGATVVVPRMHQITLGDRRDERGPRPGISPEASLSDRPRRGGSDLRTALQPEAPDDRCRAVPRRARARRAGPGGVQTIRLSTDSGWP